jgi:hypothetical protein
VWQRILLIWILILLTTACVNDKTIPTAGGSQNANAPALDVHFPQLINPQPAYLEARLTGELTLENGCLRVQETDAISTLLIWDSRFSLADDKGVIKIINSSTGEALASVGDFVAVGGGYMDDPTALGLKEPLPENCPGSY